MEHDHHRLSLVGDTTRRLRARVAITFLIAAFCGGPAAARAGQPLVAHRPASRTQTSLKACLTSRADDEAAVEMPAAPPLDVDATGNDGAVEIGASRPLCTARDTTGSRAPPSIA